MEELESEHCHSIQQDIFGIVDTRININVNNVNNCFIPVVTLSANLHVFGPLLQQLLP